MGGVDGGLVGVGDFMGVGDFVGDFGFGVAAGVGQVGLGGLEGKGTPIEAAGEFGRGF